MKKITITDARNGRLIEVSVSALKEMEAAAKRKNEDIDTSDPDARVMPYDPNRRHGKLKDLMFRPVKESLTLRVDADVLDWFKQGGDGYQTRMNAALRSHMEGQQSPRSKRSL